MKGDGDDYEVSTLKGNCAGCSELLKYYYLGGISPHYKVDRLQQDGGSLLLSSEEGHGRMFVYENAGYRVITSSVVVGAIANSDSLNIKPYILSEFINYFIGYNPVTNLTENVERILSGSVFPNPVSTQATIFFNMTEPGHVIVRIYDLNGRLIEELANEMLEQGEHHIEWAPGKRRANIQNSGFYICSIQTGDQTITKKLILLPQTAE